MDPKIKFANIDEKIDVTQDPNINRLMNGPASSANQLIVYLKKKLKIYLHLLNKPFLESGL